MDFSIVTRSDKQESFIVYFRQRANMPVDINRSVFCLSPSSPYSVVPPREVTVSSKRLPSDTAEELVA